MFNLDHPDGPPVEVLEVEDDTASDDSETEADEEEAGPNIQERLRLRTFVASGRSIQSDPHWVKIADIFADDKSDAQILKELVNSFDDPLFDKYSKRLHAVRRIRDYPYVMHVLDKELSYEVAEVFVRVSSLGIKLRGSDLALAKITSRWQDSLKLFEQFQGVFAFCGRRRRLFCVRHRFTLSFTHLLDLTRTITDIKRQKQEKSQQK